MYLSNLSPSIPILLLMDQISIKTANWRKVFIYLRPPPLIGFFGVVKQFCRFGIWSNTQCITPEYALHITPPPPVTHCLYIPVLIHTGKWGGGGGVNWREGRGALVENTNMTNCISSL
jgi:hypothetical protein